MSLPMAAGGPLNVLMKPILAVFSCAAAGPATNASTVAAAMPLLIIAFLPSGWRSTARSIFADLSQYHGIAGFCPRPILLIKPQVHVQRPRRPLLVTASG